MKVSDNRAASLTVLTHSRVALFAVSQTLVDGLEVANISLHLCLVLVLVPFIIGVVFVATEIPLG